MVAHENAANRGLFVNRLGRLIGGKDAADRPIRLLAGATRRIAAIGQNKRIQESDPVTHAEIDCLRNAGRIGSFCDTVLYSTLMPCYLCSGAVVQFGIRRVSVGESRTFPGGPEFMRAHRVEVIDLNLPECVEMMTQFIAVNLQLWDKGIGR